MAFVHAPSRTGSHVAERFNVALEAIKSFRARRAAFNRCFNELALLSDRELSDIGISRMDIPTIAAQEAAKV